MEDKLLYRGSSSSPPYLRHSDYVVEYTIRSYSDPAEIGRIMKKRPQNLSLNEFHVYAQTLEPGRSHGNTYNLNYSYFA